VRLILSIICASLDCCHGRFIRLGAGRLPG
jgi:hypothetical protein